MQNSIGESRINKQHNPIQKPEVSDVKYRAIRIIDELELLRNDLDRGLGGEAAMKSAEQSRMLSLCGGLINKMQSEMELLCMASVKTLNS